MLFFPFLLRGYGGALKRRRILLELRFSSRGDRSGSYKEQKIQCNARKGKRRALPATFFFPNKIPALVTNGVSNPHGAHQVCRPSGQRVTRFIYYEKWGLPPDPEVSWLIQEEASISPPSSFRGQPPRTFARRVWTCLEGGNIRPGGSDPASRRLRMFTANAPFGSREYPGW